MDPKELASHYKQVNTNLLTWLAIHGNLCLALRHPKNRGVSRKYVLHFTKELGNKLVQWGVITEQELKAVEKTELEEGSIDFGA